jgi:hypothetical protein
MTLDVAMPSRSPAHRRWPSAAIAVAFALGATSCEDSAQFSVKYAPGFAEGRTTISVFGVFRDGRMNADTWTQIGGPLSASFGEGRCDAAYGEALARANPDLYAAVDEEARSNGITDDLLARVAGDALGDVIMIISVHGRAGLPAAEPAGSDPPPVGNTRPSMRGGGAGGARGRGRRLTPASGAGNTLEISASLFDVRQRRSVAKVSMRYLGASIDDALVKFAQRLGTIVPGSTCRGWKWSPKAEAPTAPAPLPSGLPEL